MIRSPEVLLLELIPDDPLRHYRAETFPFIAGLLDAVDVPCAWASVGLPLNMSFDYRLSPDDEAAVIGQIRDVAPTHVLVNEHVVEEQWSRIQASSPGVRFVFRERSDLAGLREFLVETVGLGELPSALLSEDWLDGVRPRYRRDPWNAMARDLRPLVHVLAGPRCTYRRPLADNPAYADIDTAGCHDGCSFCGRDWTPYKVGSFLDFAVRQVVRADRDLGESASPLRLELVSAALWHKLEAFVEALHGAAVRPFELFLSPRLDEVLVAGDALDRLLPLLEGRGDALRLYTSGVESFSDEENLRLNKGIGLAEIQAATARLVAWMEAWPGTFDLVDGGLSAILFTPWTTMEDVAENLRHLRTNPLISADYALGTRLLLFPGRAVTLLAHRDGLIADGFDDHAGSAGCKIRWDQEELPWRFRDPKVALFFRLARRLSGEGDLPADDADRGRVEAWRRGLPAEEQGILTLGLKGCQALAEDPGIGDLRGLVAAIHARLTATVPFRWPGEGGRILVDAQWRDRVKDALAQVRRRRPDLLVGATIGEISLARSDGLPALRLEFIGPDRAALVVWMQDADLPVRAYLRNDSVALWVDGETPLGRAWMEEVMDLLARVCERLAPRGPRPPSL